ncbi:MAG: glycosyltransferase [Chloroflexota bacterium]|nr:glycosyltransferase [Chloroflexota bacterium]
MKRHILIVADGRSPTAQSWIENVLSLGYRVSLISTFHCEKLEGIAHFYVLPVAFSRFSAGSKDKMEESTHNLRKLVKRFAPRLQKLRYTLGPLSLLRYSRQYQTLVNGIAPDLVHALRIPYEGMLASYTPKHIPLILAIWGNDLTLHAKGSWMMGYFTRESLSRANGLTSDTQRDIPLAINWGLSSDSPVLTVPGSGGLDLAAIENTQPFINRYGIPKNTTWVVNPRGLRPGSVHQEVFFEAIPEVLKGRRDISFICPNLDGQPQAQAWVKQFDVEKHAFLLPKLAQSQLWDLFKKSALFISPSSHDGTPNTLLEAMACGCLPILGDIDSLREWIDHGKNGLLVDPHNPHALAQSILTGLNQPNLRRDAAEINYEIIKNRASKNVTRPKIEDFYSKLLD